jgi:hypothetical protein
MSAIELFETECCLRALNRRLFESGVVASRHTIEMLCVKKLSNKEPHVRQHQATFSESAFCFVGNVKLLLPLRLSVFEHFILSRPLSILRPRM